MSTLAAIPALNFLQPSLESVQGFMPDVPDMTPSEPSDVEDDFREDDAGFVSSPTGAASGDELPCTVCGLPVPWKGRGRKPKTHTECKTSGGKSSVDVGDGPRPVRVSKNRVERVGDELYRGMGELAGGLAPFAPVTSATILYRSENLVNGLMTLAQKHPRLMDGLEAATAFVPWLDVASFAGAVVFAVGVDVGQLKPEGFFAERLGVAEAARQIGWQAYDPSEPQSEYQPATVDGSLAPPPPTRFQPLGKN